MQRVQEWVGIHHEDYNFQPGRSRICEHSASGGNGFGNPSRHNPRFLHHTEVICENCTQHCPCTTGIQHCVCVCMFMCARTYVCMVGTKICDGNSQKLMLGDALSLLQSFKVGANRLSKSMVMFGDMVSPFH